jgi:hypothetical protein
MLNQHEWSAYNELRALGGMPSWGLEGLVEGPVIVQTAEFLHQVTLRLGSLLLLLGAAHLCD